MYFASFLDIPSLLFSSSALVVGGISGGLNIQKSIAITRDIAIPIGVVGTLVGFVNMLSQIDDPSTLGPSIGISFLTTLYGLLLFVLFNTIYSWFPEESTEIQEHMLTQNGVATGIFLIVLIAAINIGGNVFHFIDVTSITFVFFFAILPTLLMNSKNLTKSSYWVDKSKELCKYSIITLFAGMLYSSIMMLVNFENPAAIGPAMAVGLLTPFYCCLLIIGGIVTGVTLSKPQKPNLRTSLIITSILIGTSIFIACCAGILFSLI